MALHLVFLSRVPSSESEPPIQGAYDPWRYIWFSLAESPAREAGDKTDCC